MRVTLCHLGLAFIIVVTGQAQAFSKRGLVYVPSAKYPQDDQFWDSPSSCLTWYYNYADTPSRSYHGSKLDFVPQLWGHPSDKTGTAFLDSVTAQIKDGANITYVLGFNEPDMSSYGGSGIDPSTAAEIWQREIEPLGKLGVKLGSPGCSSSPNGISWMKQFQAACSNCTMDFMAVHFYGSFQGLANHIGEYVGTFNKTVWVTEYGFPHASLKDSQAFYNESSSFMDRNPNITRYSYFGAFRSDVSNVGTYGTFLTQKGKLTDIGSWYLGGTETGHKPSGGAVSQLSPTIMGFLGVVAIVFNLV